MITSMITKLRVLSGVAVVSSIMLLTTSCEMGSPCEDPSACQLRAATMSNRPAGKLVPATGAYLGAYSSSGTWSGNQAFFTYYASREATVGRKFDIANHFYGWNDPIPSGLEQWDLANGRIPLITWEPWMGLDAINNGSQDGVISTKANGIKALGKPVFLRFGHEMNGNWYPWDGTHNGSSGANYIKAYRRIHDMFVSQGATNVVWVWEPNAEDIPTASWNHWTNYYPGDDVVDWVGIDGYNFGSTNGMTAWNSFEKLMQGIYNDYAGRKPLMISETASTETGGNKAQWIRDASTAVKSKFPSIAAVLWFDQKKETDWRFDSSTNTLNAFRVMAADPYFRPSSTVAPTTSAATAPAAAPPSVVNLVVSTLPTLSPAQPLQSSVLSGKQYIRATTAVKVKQMRFYLDDPAMKSTPHRVEAWEPYDFEGGAAFDVSSLTPGNHWLTVASDLASGGTQVTYAVFTR
jgi:hypothetical protein